MLLFVPKKILHRCVGGRGLSTTLIHKIRNVGIVAHIDAGKTTTTEQFLFCSGETNVMGRVDNGNSVMDFLPQERERGITISSAAISFKWDDHSINLIDTPGHVDFTIEVERAVRAMDGSVVIVDALAGVQAQTRTVWRQVQDQKLPCIAFVNKMDRDGADFSNAILSLQKKLDVKAIPIQLPIMKNGDYIGVVDLIGMQSIYWTGNASNTKCPSTEKLVSSHEEYAAATVERAKMFEMIADADEEFLETFLNSEVEDISEEIILHALRRCCVAGQLVPALCGASLKGAGIEPLLDAITTLLPSPLDRGALVAADQMKGSTIEVSSNGKEFMCFAFKVVVDQNRGPLVYIRNLSGELPAKSGMLWNSSKRKKERPHQLLRVSADELRSTDSIGFGDIGCIVGLKHTETGDTLVSQNGAMKNYVLDGLSIPDIAFSLAVEPEKASHYDKLIESLSILVLEDPSLRYEVNEESGQLLMHGIGELHLEIVCDKLERRFGIPVEIGEMSVAYRESISAGQGIDNKTFVFDKVMGGKHFFAEITGSLHHDDSLASPSIVVDDIVRKSLKSEECFALIDGLQKSFSVGPHGYPLIGVSVVITSVKFETSTGVGSIRACVSKFIESCLKSVDGAVYEPYMSLVIDLPAIFVGDVLSDLTMKRKAVVNDVTTTSHDFSIISGHVPLSTMLGYASTVRSLTQGQGEFSMEYTGHQVVVDYVAD